jgi:Rhodopirellula transposase DDE domain
MITADGGGSNGSRLRLWKVALQQLADETGLIIQVCHYPPGTSRGVGRRDCTSSLSQNGA